MVCPLEVAKLTLKLIFFLSSLASKLCHLETNRVLKSIENALLYITAKNGFLKTHIYEKCRPFFERLCGQNLKFKNFEFVGLNLELIMLTFELTGGKNRFSLFQKKNKHFFHILFCTLFHFFQIFFISFMKAKLTIFMCLEPIFDTLPTVIFVRVLINP